MSLMVITGKSTVFDGEEDTPLVKASTTMMYNPLVSIEFSDPELMTSALDPVNHVAHKTILFLSAFSLPVDLKATLQSSIMLPVVVVKSPILTICNSDCAILRLLQKIKNSRLIFFVNDIAGC